MIVAMNLASSTTQISTGRWSNGLCGCRAALAPCKGRQITSVTLPVPIAQCIANQVDRYAPEKIEYGIKRYQTETKRLYQVLEDRLASQRSTDQGSWIIGDKYTIADLACFSWINWAEWAGVSTNSFPNVEKWMERIQKRPATEKGVNIPEKFEMKEAMRTKEGEEEFAKHHSNWVIQGQKADQERHQ